MKPPNHDAHMRTHKHTKTCWCHEKTSLRQHWSFLLLFCFHLHKNDLLLSRQAFLLSSLYSAWSLGLSTHTYVQILCVLCIFVWVCVDDCAVHTFMHDCPCAVLCAVMCAGKRTCTNASVYMETSTCIFTFHLRFILSQAPLLPPQLSV